LGFHCSTCSKSITGTTLTLIGYRIYGATFSPINRMGQASIGRHIIIWAVMFWRVLSPIETLEDAPDFFDSKVGESVVTNFKWVYAFLKFGLMFSYKVVSFLPNFASMWVMMIAFIFPVVSTFPILKFWCSIINFLIKNKYF